MAELMMNEVNEEQMVNDDLTVNDGYEAEATDGLSPEAIFALGMAAGVTLYKTGDAIIHSKPVQKICHTVKSVGAKAWNVITGKKKKTKLEIVEASTEEDPEEESMNDVVSE